MSLISGLGSYNIDPSSLYQKHNNSRNETTENRNVSHSLETDFHEDKISYPSEEMIQEDNTYGKSSSRNMSAYRQIMGFGSGNGNNSQTGSSVDIVV